MDASIVLVDNESKYLVAYERLLRPLRCKILCAQRRSDALPFLSAPRIALVVVEPCLADGDGLELILIGRTLRPPESGIVVTAFPSRWERGGPATQGPQGISRSHSLIVSLLHSRRDSSRHGSRTASCRPTRRPEFANRSFSSGEREGSREHRT